MDYIYLYTNAIVKGVLNYIFMEEGACEGKRLGPTKSQ